MKKILFAIIGVALLTSASSITAQSETGSLQGVWQTVEVTIGGQTPRTLKPADPKAWMTIFTAKHYSRTEVQAETPRTAIADVSKATADELRTLWGTVIAEAGTYELSGDTLTLHPTVSKSPAAMAAGAFIVNTIKLDGDNLTIAQQRNQSGPYPNPVTFKLKRVE